MKNSVSKGCVFEADVMIGGGKRGQFRMALTSL